MKQSCDLSLFLVLGLVDFGIRFYFSHKTKWGAPSHAPLSRSHFGSVRICIRLDNLFFEISREFSVNLPECRFFIEKTRKLVTA